MVRLSDIFLGRRDKLQQMPTMTPEQQQALSRVLTQGLETNPLYQQGSSYLQQLLSGSPEAFSAFEAPYMRQFQEEIIPSIAERFGGIGGLSSSGFQQTLGRAGSGLQEQLAALRSGLQQQAAQTALPYSQAPYSNLLSALGARPFENVYRPGGSGLLGALAPGLGMGIGASFGNQLGGSLGGMLGLGQGIPPFMRG